jgi:hypothetical protein
MVRGAEVDSESKRLAWDLRRCSDGHDYDAVTVILSIRRWPR